MGQLTPKNQTLERPHILKARAFEYFASQSEMLTKTSPRSWMRSTGASSLLGLEQNTSPPALRATSPASGEATLSPALEISTAGALVPARTPPAQCFPGSAS